MDQFSMDTRKSLQWPISIKEVKSSLAEVHSRIKHEIVKTLSSTIFLLQLRQFCGTREDWAHNFVT